MPLEELTIHCKYIYGITQIPIIITNSQGNDAICIPPVDAFKNAQYISCLTGCIKEQDVTSTRLLSDGPHSTYGIIPFSPETDKAKECYYLILGPCLDTELNFMEYYNTSTIFSVYTLEHIKEAFLYFPKVSSSYLMTTLSLLHYTIFHQIIAAADILKYGLPSAIIDDISYTTQETLFTRRESFQFHTPYSYELKHLEIIRNGDLDKLHDILADIEVGKPGVLSKNPLRQKQNLLIIGITLYTRAAIQGGIPEETAFAMSDSFIQAAESCRDIRTIDELSKKATYDFTKKVADYKEKKQYSTSIEICLDYIHKHLHYNISLSELAKAAKLSPGQLSRKFKKEIGVSFVAYVQKEKIESAKNLLCFSDYSFLEISNYLSFGTQSYFIEIFKKHTGFTPAGYRLKYQKASFISSTYE